MAIFLGCLLAGIGAILAGVYLLAIFEKLKIPQFLKILELCTILFFGMTLILYGAGILPPLVAWILAWFTSALLLGEFLAHFIIMQRKIKRREIAYL